MAGKPTLLIINQVYVPDSVSVGQHVHDTAAEMARRGYRVKVYASARSYDDGSEKYPSHEVIDGVEVRRLPLSSFGKSSIAKRLIGGGLFTVQAMLRGLFTGRLKHILISTSPPMAPIAAIFIQLIRGTPITFWAMDINPDQMIAIGKITERSLPARVFNRIYRSLLKRSKSVVALDNYMAQSLERKTPVRERMAVMPPWPHDSKLETVPHDENPFRQEHGLVGKRVIMYSGNLSPVHPLTTLLEAAKEVRDDDRLVFMFIGGGLGMQVVKEFIQANQLTNARTLPYQPMSQMKYSLSAADVHVVSVGNEMVGVVHPCKIYGAMSVGRPVLLLGKEQSHAGEILGRHPIGWRVDHGDVSGAVEVLKTIAAAPDERLAQLGRAAQQASRETYSMANLMKCFCDVIEHGVTERQPHLRPHAASPQPS